MMSQALVRDFCCRFAVLAAVAGSCCADEVGQLAAEEAAEVELTPEQLEGERKVSEALAALQDTAFDRFVSPVDLQVAYQTLDVERLIDCALQLAEGERVLLRGHNSGIKPADLLEFAAQVAARLGQTESFDRMLLAADKVRAADLVRAMQAAKQLAAQPRAASVDLGDYQAIYQHINRSELLRDEAELDATGEDLPEDFSDAQKKAVLKAVAEAKQRIQESTPATAIEKLAAPSRFILGPSIAIVSMPSVGYEGYDYKVQTRIVTSSYTWRVSLFSDPWGIESVSGNVGPVPGIIFRTIYLNTKIANLSRTRDVLGYVQMSRWSGGNLLYITKTKPVRLINK